MLKLSRVYLFFIFIVISSNLWANQQLIIEPDMGRAPLLTPITNAKSSIDLVMYGFTDSAFANALIAAKNKNVNVRVLLQHYPYKADDENKTIINQLQAAHINLEWPDGDYKLTHQKTFLIDNNTAIIMTFNLTHSTFKNERNFALIIDDPQLTAEIKQVFAGDWQHQNTQVQQSDLLWSPNNSREKMLSFIRSAKSEIKMYAEGLNDYQIIGALAKAARSGIKVQVITNENRDHIPSKKIAYLSKAGVTIAYDKQYHIHAKVIMIDHTSAVLGSINFTQPSINNNRELAVITRDTKVIQQLNDLFESDWQQTNATSPASKLIHSKMDIPEAYLIAKNLRQIAKMVKTQHRYKPRKHTKKKYAFEPRE